jgi:hypothetical protein
VGLGVQESEMPAKKIEVRNEWGHTKLFVDGKPFVPNKTETVVFPDGVVSRVSIRTKEFRFSVPDHGGVYEGTDVVYYFMWSVHGRVVEIPLSDVMVDVP